MEFEKEREQPQKRNKTRSQGQSDLGARGQFAPESTPKKSELKDPAPIGQLPDRGALVIFLILVLLTCIMALVMRALL